METADIALIMSSIATIAAVAVPIATTLINAKSNEEMKKTELHIPKMYEEIGKLAAAYSRLERCDPIFTNNFSEENMSARFAEFMICVYTVLPLIADNDVRSRLCDFFERLEKTGKFTNESTDGEFNQLIADIAACLANPGSKKKPVHKKKD